MWEGQTGNGKESSCTEHNFLTSVAHSDRVSSHSTEVWKGGLLAHPCTSGISEKYSLPPMSLE